MDAFDYLRPASLDAAVAALAADPEAMPLAGGQTLLPVLRARLARPSLLVDLGRLSDLRGIALSDRLVVGGGTTHAEVADDATVRDACPALAALAGGIGDPMVRHRGTLGGSIANNDPGACYPSAALALAAEIRTSRRVVAADDFFTGMFATALAPGELVTAVAFRPCRAAAYVKLANPASRFALIGVFVARLDTGTRVAVTGGGAGVFRWRAAEDHLDAGGTADALASVALDADRFNADGFGSVAYRLHLTRVATRRAVAAIAAS